MSLKRVRSPSPAKDAQPFTRSTSISDRSSTFIGFYSPLLSASDLQALDELGSASHRIAAWRKQSPQRTISPTSQPLYDMGHDDDGEKYGGKHLEKVLSDMRVEGAIVVARWYGGVMLGPVRFTHLESCAKDAVKAWQDAEAEKSRQAKKKRQFEEEERVDRPKLERVLQERDRSIEVLRQLLVEKNSRRIKVNHLESTDQDVAPPTPKKVTEYSKMSVMALRKLERARDATLTFILRELDKIEAEGKSEEEAQGEKYGAVLYTVRPAEGAAMLQESGQCLVGSSTSKSQDGVP